MLFVCGYLYRKSRIRELSIKIERKHRLEEAAWKVVYQYEKLLQENEHAAFEEEFRQVVETAKQEEEARNPVNNASIQQKQMMQRKSLLLREETF